MPDKKQKLSPKEYEALLKTMRFWNPAQRDEVAKLVWHAAWQKDQIDRMEKDLHTYRQADMFREKQANDAKLNQVPVVKEPPPEKWPLRKRLYTMKMNGLLSGPIWEQTLRWNSITNEKALSLIDEFEKEHGVVDKK